MPDQDPPRLGRLALDRGLVTAEQLEAALRVHGERTAAGSQVPLGELLVEMGFITRTQLGALVAAQAKPDSPRQPIEGFELIKKLGEGGMGATFLARQISMDRLVALKLLKKNLARDSSFVARFQREAQLAGKLGHPNIVSALTVGESGGYHYLAMEYVEGRNAFAAVPPGEAMEQKRALGIVLQVARALEAADREGIVHRDIKPDNILVTAEGLAKLCDFGLARQTEADSRLTQTGTMLGTPHYVSPEQARGDAAIDIRADIYSLGATLYHFVTGRTPFQGPSAAAIMAKHLTDRMPWPRDLNPRVSEGCCRVIARMMAKEPADRYQTPAELIADLESLVAGRPPAGAPAAVRSSVGGAGETPVEAEARPAGRRQPTRHRTTAATGPVSPVAPPGRSRMLLAAVAAGGLLLAGALVWLAASSGATAPGPDGPTLPAEGLLQPPPETRTPDPADPGRAAARELEAMFVYAREFREKNPGDFDGALAKFTKVRDQARGTKWSLAAEDAMAEVLKARAAAAEAAFAPARDRSVALAEAGDFDGALEALARAPAGFADELGPRIKAESGALRARAENRASPVLAAAEELSKAGEPARALAELDKLSAVKYAPLGPRLAALRRRLEDEQRNAAELERRRLAVEAARRRDVLLGAFDTELAAGRFREAAAGLEAGRKSTDPRVLALVSADLDAAGRLAACLTGMQAARESAIRGLAGREFDLSTKAGVHRVTVTAADGLGLDVERWYAVGGERKSIRYRIAFSELAAGELARLLPPPEPRNADEHLALAVLAANGGDLASAGRFLAGAGGGPLVARVRARLDLLTLGAADAAAKGAWEATVVPLAGDRYDVPGARKVLAALEAFTRDHGATRFAAGVAAERDRLRGLAEAAIDASPEGLSTRVRRLFRGKVEKFDARTLAVELSWDFSDPAQLEDFEFSPGAWKIENAALVGEMPDPPGPTQAVLKAWFAPDCRVGCSATVFRGRGWYVTVTSGGDLIGAFSSLVDYNGQPQPRAALMRVGAYGEQLASAAAKPYTDIRAGEARTVEVTLSGAQVVGAVDGKPLGELKGLACAAVRARLGFHGMGTRASFSGLRISGTLDRTWLESAAPLVGAPCPWRAAWTKMKTRVASPAYSAAAFDTKRGQYLIFDDNRTLTAYSLAADKAEVIHRPGPGDAADLPPRLQTPGAVYDPGRDELLATGHAGAGTIVYSFADRRWTVSKSATGAQPCLFSGGGADFCLWSGASSHLFYLSRWDPAKAAWEEVKCRMPPGRCYPGDIAAWDSARKRLVMFSGAPHLNDTWAYDAEKNEWAELRPAFCPPGRTVQSTAYDADNDLIVVIGGRKPLDTWVFDAKRNSWFDVSSREQAGELITQIEYDPGNKCLIARNPAWNGGTIWTLRISPAAR
ncbi:MAG TPA: protein kinase [Planctomycetota bacterium]|nr:protein kinase [Planctomycetota bacterium]